MHVMTKENDLTELQQIIYDALLANGDYMTRSDIASAIGRESGLTHYDVKLLSQLVDMDFVQVHEEKRGVTMTSYRYRVIG